MCDGLNRGVCVSVMKHFCVIIAVACKYLVATAGVDALNSKPLVIDDLYNVLLEWNCVVR